MDVLKVELDCAKETLELAQGLGKTIAAVKVALADGWQPGADMPAVLTAVITDLVPAIQGVEKLGSEAGLSAEFINALYAGLVPEVLKLVKKA